MEKQYVINKADELIYENRMKLLKILIDDGAKVCECGDGCYIDLNRVSDDVIKDLYETVKQGLIVPEQHRF